MISSERVQVSIVTPSYCSEKYISHALNSVISQSFQSWEMLVVDDCSPDESSALIQSFSDRDPRIKLIQLNENGGAAIARNKGIEQARGRYIAFLDSDDCWLPNKLEKQIKFMRDNDVSLSYTAYEKMDEYGEVFGRVGVPKQVSYKELLKTCSIGCLTVVYDAAKLGKVYMPLSTKREDFATWLSILKRVEHAHGLNETLARYRVYSEQSSSRKIRMAKENWRLYRDVENLGLVQSVYYFSNYAVRGVLRTKFPRTARMLGVLC